MLSSCGDSEWANSSEDLKTFLPLDLMLKHSIEIPLRSQFQLVSAELLSFFFDNESNSLWRNLEAVRNYLLLNDSEFAHNLCLGLIDHNTNNRHYHQEGDITDPINHLLVSTHNK